MSDEVQSLLALAEQRRKQAAARLNRVCSAQYKWDLALEAKNMSIHAVLRGIEERPGEISGLAMLLLGFCRVSLSGVSASNDSMVMRSDHKDRAPIWAQAFMFL